MSLSETSRQHDCKMQVENISMPRSTCYMCYFSDDQNCVHYTEFIIRESHRSTSREMAQQIHEEMSQHEPDANSKGASVKDIDKHIRKHMLHPAVKVPAILRDLDSVRETLQDTLVTKDAESGAKVIESNNVVLYLKVVRELNQMYKLGDITKLSFGSHTALPKHE
jgi:hypothetical protein